MSTQSVVLRKPKRLAAIEDGFDDVGRQLGYPDRFGNVAYFNLQKEEALDLGKLIKRLEKEGKIIAVNAANIIARLHARAKPSEQEKRVLRPIREQDSDLAVQCVGALLCEIGIAEWA